MSDDLTEILEEVSLDDPVEDTARDKKKKSDTLFLFSLSGKPIANCDGDCGGEVPPAAIDYIVRVSQKELIMGERGANPNKKNSNVLFLYSLSGESVAHCFEGEGGEVPPAAIDYLVRVSRAELNSPEEISFGESN